MFMSETLKDIYQITLSHDKKSFKIYLNSTVRRRLERQALGPFYYSLRNPLSTLNGHCKLTG